MLVFLLYQLLLKEHCQEGRTGHITQLILMAIAQQLLAFCSFTASSRLFPQAKFFNSRSSLLLKHVACVGFLLSETLHAPLDFDKDCSCVFCLNPVILHNTLGVAVMCKRVVSVWDSSPVYCLLAFTLLVLAPATVSAVRVPECLGAAALSRWEGQTQCSWLQYSFSY